VNEEHERMVSMNLWKALPKKSPKKQNPGKHYYLDIKEEGEW